MASNEEQDQGPPVLYYIGILRTAPGSTTVELAGQRDYSTLSRFTSGRFNEVITMMSKNVAARTQAGTRQSVKEGTVVGHAYGRSGGICGIAATKGAYSKLAAHALLSKVMDEFTTRYTATDISSKPPSYFETYANTELKEYIVKYQDPKKADSLTVIRNELEDTKIVLHQTIESVLERGEKLDTLVAKSEDLSMSTKLFYQSAKKQNSCCVVM